MIILGYGSFIMIFVFITIIGFVFLLLFLMILRKNKSQFKSLVKTFSIMVIVLIIFLSIFYIWYSDNKVSYEYSIEITTANNNNIELYIPIPLTNDEKISEITDYLKIEKGNGQFDIITTDYGKALQIKSSGNITLASSGKSGESVFQTFSLINDSLINKPIKFWIYTNFSIPSANVYLSLKCKEIGPQYEREISFLGNLQSGWQLIDGMHRYIVE